MNRMQTWCNHVANALILIAGVLAVILMIHVTLDAFARYLLNRTIGATLEIASLYYMVPLSLLPLAALVLRGELLSVEFLTSSLPRGLRAVLDMANQTLLAIVSGVLTWLSTLEAIDKTREGEVWESISGLIPAWPSRWFLPIAFGLVFVSALVRVRLTTLKLSSSSD